MLKTHNDQIFERYTPYVVSTEMNRPFLELSPFGLETGWQVDPTKMDSGVFMDLLQRLDALTFGPEGMPMDKWVFYDCAELPGYIYGFAVDVSDLDARERELFRVPDGYQGPVPFSMYIAIPMHEEGHWFGHNLASLNRTFPERRLRHLGSITKAIALKSFRVRRFVGATQWTSGALFVHTKFGPLELESAYTPAHSIPETLTYAFTVTDASLLAAAGDASQVLERPTSNFTLDAEDVEGMQRVQAEIEAGRRYVMVGPPVREGDRVVHQLYRT